MLLGRAVAEMDLVWFAQGNHLLDPGARLLVLEISGKFEFHICFSFLLIGFFVGGLAANRRNLFATASMIP
jgi:hypothetical protein